MSRTQVELETQGIKSALKNYKPYDAIAEYIWNGYDASATEVHIDFILNEMGYPCSLSISDNGSGIEHKLLAMKFKPIFQSQKAINRSDQRNCSTTHGKNGVGRFTFYQFSTDAFWKTVYCRDEKNYMYSISIQSSSLHVYEDIEDILTDSQTGTTVTFSNFAIKNFSIDDLGSYLAKEFAWYLELNKPRNYKLVLNGVELDYSSLLGQVERISYTDEASKATFSVTYCCWLTKLHEEYSKYYYIASNGKEQYKENTTLNNKGDRFYHSVFIQSAIFDNFTFEADDEAFVLSGLTKNSAEYKYIKFEVDKHLREMRKPFVKQYANTYIASLKEKGAYPAFSTGNIIDKVREEALDEMVSVIYSTEPQIFSSLNVTQQKTLIRLFDLTMQSGEIEGLYKIIGDIVEMSAEDRDELASLLKYTNLSHITKTVAVIKDRLEAIERLKKITFSDDNYANEIEAVQPFIEKNYWLFGEEYYLVTAEEPDFVEALRRFHYILTGEQLSRGEANIDCPDKNKEMDIFAVQRQLSGQVKKCIVVELKRPQLTLGQKELLQVKKYLQTIAHERRFSAPNIEWVFFLVGSKYNDEIESELENAKGHGEKSLVFKDKDKKIYVKTWSEIITEHEISLNFLNEKLALQQGKIIGDVTNMSLQDAVSASSSADRPAEFDLDSQPPIKS